MPTDSDAPSLESLVARVPEGWTAVSYAGRRYGLTRTTHTDGRSVSVFAEELGGPDVVSANVFRLSGGAELRPCEMPAAKVLDFLEGWLPLGGDVSAVDGPDNWTGTDSGFWAVRSESAPRARPSVRGGCQRD